MPAFPQAVLCEKLKGGLPKARFSSGEATRPAHVSVPGLADVRIYLWTLTTIRSEDRDPSEYKIELILPNQKRGERGELELADKPTFLFGYSPNFGVFVGWQASLHREFGYSSTVHVQESTLEEARATGWAVDPPRKVKAGIEVSVAFSPANLKRFMEASIQADKEGKFGVSRELHYLLYAPNETETVVTQPGEDLVVTVNKVRGDVFVKRKSRDAAFGSMIVAQYGFACAVCQLQLDIVQGAHIIPVRVEHSTDEKWNGLALCPNHHALFDAYLFTITNGLKVSVDMVRLDYLKRSKMDLGAEEFLIAFDQSDLRKPYFMSRDRPAAKKMFTALQWHAATAAIAPRKMQS